MKVSFNNPNQYFNNHNNSFRAIYLPPKDLIPASQDGWNRLYVLCKENNKLGALKSSLENLNNSKKEGFLGCFWSASNSYPTFLAEKTYEKFKKLSDDFSKKYVNRLNTTNVMLDKDHKGNIVSQIFDARINKRYDSEILETNGHNNEEKVCDAIIKTINDIATDGTKQNEVFFDSSDDFFSQFRKEIL